jgi:capsular exopolysaccharide synthesis family protein
MRRPRIHRIFGLPNTTGLSALIVGEEKLENAVQPTVVPNLFILPCGPIPPNPAELLQTEGFKSVLAEMCRSFDRVILDSPPIGVVADAAVLSTGVDGTLLVLKAGRTSRDAAKQGIKQLRDVNARLFGAVLNDLDLQDQKYGQYYHYYRYGYYYGDKKESSAA